MTFSKIIGIIMCVCAIVTTICTIYKPDKLKLEVKTIEKIQVAKKPVFEGLSAEYYYLDSKIENLWKIKAVISNIGSKTIDGRGKDSFDSLFISFKDSAKIFSIENDSSNFKVSIVKNNERAYLNFKQWRPSKFIRIIAIVENLGKTDPLIFIDEEDYIDLEVTNKQIETNTEKINGFDKIIVTINIFFVVMVVILGLIRSFNVYIICTLIIFLLNILLKILFTLFLRF